MDGRKDIILDIANRSIEKAILHNEEWVPSLNDKGYTGLTENQGAFTTIYKLLNDEKSLRGCIGYPYPIYPLVHSIALSARQAALKDSRFKPVDSKELPELIIEVETLSQVKKFDYNSIEELYSKIEIGKHGLIISFMGSKGLLLPKVATRYNWDVKAFLENTCKKAGLPRDVYLRDAVEILYFSSQLYAN